MKIINCILAAALSVNMACKKERTCDCTITKSGTITTKSQFAGFPPLVPPIDSSSVEQYLYRTSYIEKYDKMNKRDMRLACPQRTDEMVFETTSNSVAGFINFATTDSGSVVKECVIK